MIIVRPKISTKTMRKIGKSGERFGTARGTLPRLFQGARTRFTMPAPVRARPAACARVDPSPRALRAQGGVNPNFDILERRGERSLQRATSRPLIKKSDRASHALLAKDRVIRSEKCARAIGIDWSARKNEEFVISSIRHPRRLHSERPGVSSFCGLGWGEPARKLVTSCWSRSTARSGRPSERCDVVCHCLRKSAGIQSADERGWK